jgi:hypothetical protein
VVLLAAGLLAAFYGYRLLRVSLPLICAELGYALGAALWPWAGWTMLAIVPFLIVASGTTALVRPRVAAVVASGATWIFLGEFLAARLGLGGATLWLVAALLGSVGTVLTLVSRDSMIVLLTSIHGAAWMIVGLVGLAASLLPALCTTFQNWADDQPLVMPVLLAMLVTTAYTCQINNLRGDLRVGPVAEEQGPRDSR